MCPLWPFHIVIMYLLMMAPLCILTWGATVKAMKSLPFKFNPSSLEMEMGQTKRIEVYSEDKRAIDYNWIPEAEKERDYVVRVSKTFLVNTGDRENWTSVFDVTANILGKADVKLKSYDENNKTEYESSDSLTVTVVREKRVIDKVFTYSVVILVSILYINFGCALDWDFVKEILKKPVGPLIGFVCQFGFMPLFGFGLGRLLFPDMPEMQLGLFFTGLSPGGGASNIWSVALEANVDLSIAMTTISSLAAFGMIPFWLFALGHNIFAEAKLSTPYSHISHYVVCLIVPLAIGYAVQRFLPRVSKILVRLLKPLSVSLIIFIVIFACVTNAYIFKLFTWQILVAGLALPWLGYFIGYVAAFVLRQPMENVMTIAIETGVQNTGIAIFMLRLSLTQPAADITTVIPVAVAVMTPIPLTLLYICRKIRARHHEKKNLQLIKHGIINGNIQS
ncbi:UNVERIFIED_CONTAM: hypothetical protein PYX00_005354 [Menopon gallinae]|uniref:Solute carrier family 10 member 6 n=1 Tax=Menopon gallinae TaxID=328185 RepID=A0AAW2HQS1_9NEOP